MMMAHLKAGFDYSCAEAAFAVADEQGNALFDETLLIGNRDASGLAVWMERLLKERGFSFTDIEEWSVGAGPGSFTGLRLASSFVMGLAFRKEQVRCRCVSTASAIAACAVKRSGSQPETVLSLYDGRKNEILAYGLRRDGGDYVDDSFQTVIATPGQFNAILEAYPLRAALSRDHDAIAKVLGGEAAAQVCRVEPLSALPLISFRTGDFSRPLTDLVYLRPAVFVEPKPVRSVL